MMKPRIQVGFDADTYLEIKNLSEMFGTSMSKIVEQVTEMGLQSYSQGLPQLPENYQSMDNIETAKFLLETALQELREGGKNQANKSP